MKTIGTAAACSKLQLSGIRTREPPAPTASGATPPMIPPITRSPAFRWLTSSPASITTPAISPPITPAAGTA
jgi:hypothetical protein